MSILSDFEDRVGRAVEGMFAGVFRSPVQPAEVARALSKQMDRERSIGVGKVYAPTLYTVLISPSDDEKLGAFAETLSGELSTYLTGYAAEQGYQLSSRPLVRFLVDPDLKLGRFEAYAELVSADELGRIAAEMHGVDAHVPAAATPGVAPSASPGERVPVDVPPAPAPSATAIDAPPSAMPSGLGGMATVTVTGVEHDVVLHGSRVTVGRLGECDIHLEDANASRTHAAFVPDGAGWAVEDLGSTNGTIVNRRVIDGRTPLRDGDVVTVGITELVYHGPGA